MADRLPFRATVAAAPYENLALPCVLLLDNVRSLYNTGAFFRTADGAGVTKLYLCGITACPPKKQLSKTALGADEFVPWEHHADAVALARTLETPYELAAIETSARSVDLFDWTPRFPVCLMFGHEVDGLHPALLELAHTHVRIPMLGRKHSLNVATAGGIVLYELLRKYRRLEERT